MVQRGPNNTVLRMPQYIYVIIDKRTNELYKSTTKGNLPFYNSINAVTIGMKFLAARSNLDYYKVVQYELNRIGDITK